MTPLVAGRVHYIYILLFFLLGLFFLLININSPSVGEDLILMPWNFGEKPDGAIEFLLKIFNRVIHQARYWNPRIGEALAIITGAFKPIVFDLLNTIVLLYLGVLLFVFGFGRFPNWKEFEDSLALFIVYFMLVVIFPFLGQIIFWKSGTTSHTWGLVILLSFALPYRLHLNGESFLNIKLFPLILYCLLGLLAGLSVENAVVVILGLLFTIIIIKTAKHTKVTFKHILPVVFLMIGGSYLLFSPATTYRRNYYASLNYEGGLHGILLLLLRIKRVFGDYLFYSWPTISILLIFVTLFCLLCVKNKIWIRTIKDLTVNQLVILFSLLLSFFGILALIAIPYQSDQARAFAINHFIMIATIAFFAQKVFLKIPFRILKKVTLITVVVILMVDMVVIYKDYLAFYVQFSLRDESITQQINAGSRDLKITPLNILTTRKVETREMYFRNNIDDLFVTYYGVDSIIISNNKINIHNYTDSDRVSFYFDVADIQKYQINLVGWMFVEGEKSSSEGKYIILHEINGREDVFFTTNTDSIRPDVSRVFHGDYDLSGFSSYVDTQRINPGIYQIGVVIKTGENYIVAMSEYTVSVE